MMDKLALEAYSEKEKYKLFRYFQFVLQILKFLYIKIITICCSLTIYRGLKFQIAKIETIKLVSTIILFGLFFGILNLNAGMNKSIKNKNKNTYFEYFENANKFYEKSQFVDALEIYKNLYSQGLVSSALLYNMSNSYYRLGKTGYAYLYIERAYRLSPRDEDIKYNRKFILNLLGQKPNLMDNFEGCFSMNELVFIGLFFYCLLILLLILGIFFDNFNNRKLYWIKMSNLAVIILISIWIFFVYQVEYKDKLGISICPDVPVYASPDIATTAIFTIPEGKKIIIEQSDNYSDSWCNIYVQDKGLKGWVKKENIEII